MPIPLVAIGNAYWAYNSRDAFRPLINQGRVPWASAEVLCCGCWASHCRSSLCSCTAEQQEGTKAPDREACDFGAERMTRFQTERKQPAQHEIGAFANSTKDVPVRMTSRRI